MIISLKMVLELYAIILLHRINKSAMQMNHGISLNYSFLLRNDWQTRS